MPYPAIAAVFVPVAFRGGITGQLYRQFALTLSVSVLLSTLVALTLTPALGVTPLTIASGTGANARISTGTAVVSGVTAATVLGVVFIPTLYVVIERLMSRRTDGTTPGKPEEAEPEAPPVAEPVRHSGGQPPVGEEEQP